MSEISDRRHGYEMGKRGAVIVSEGYCSACHEVKPADDAGSCQTCGDPLIDLHERFILPDEQAAGATVPASPVKAGGSEPVASTGTPLVSPPVDALPPPEPPPPPPGFVAPARGSAAVLRSSVGAAPVAHAVSDRTATKLTAGVVPSRLQGAGERLLALGSIGLLFLWALQLSVAQAWVTNLNEVWGEQVFVATRAAEARTVGPLSLLATATLVLMIGLALYPKDGRGRRVADYALVWAGMVAVWLCLMVLAAADSQGPVPGWAVAGLLGGLIPVLVGAILLAKHLRPYQRALKTHLGVNRLYRRSVLSIRFGIIGVLWVLGSVWYVVILVASHGWTIQPGGYAGGALLALGLVGALAMLAGLQRPWVRIDEAGQVFKPPQADGSEQPGAPLLS